MRPTSALRFAPTATKWAPLRSSRSKPSLLSRVSTLAVVGGVAGGGLFWYYKNPQASIHEYFILPSIRLLLDAETSHNLAIELMRYPSLNPTEKPGFDDKIDPNGQLRVTLFPKHPVTLRSPVGVAAGLDKDGKAIDSLFNLGFSYVEIGSITPLAQPGNPKPRFFRLEKDGAVINRYGFNSEGHQPALARLKARLAKALCYPLPKDGSVNNSLRPEKALAVNLGKNKTGDETEDYLTGVRTFADYADVLVVNVSSPNTPGLRDLQSEAKLSGLLSKIVAERDTLANRSNGNGRAPPVVVKVAPDLSEPEIESIAGAVKSSGVDGVIVSNTTIQRPQDLSTAKSVSKETGGLSGKPLKPYSLRAVSLLRKHVGDDVTLIGCGGIANGKDAVEFAKAGADFVQLYTAFAYKGAGIADNVKQEIMAELGDQKWIDLRK